MSDIERIAPGDWITVGGSAPVTAVVCSLRPKRVEVVYLDPSNRAIHREAAWTPKGWAFVNRNEPGRPADKDARLERYVKVLRSGT